MAQDAKLNFPILFSILRSKAPRVVNKFLCFVVVVAGLASLSAAQVDRAGLNGTVSDPAGRVFPQAHVVAVPGEAFGTQEHIRLSYAVSHNVIEEGLARMKNFFVSLS